VGGSAAVVGQEERGGCGAGGGEPRAPDQGLTLAHFGAQLEDLRNTLLTLELILSTFWTHPPVTLGYIGDKVSLS
jgi:hypothetical protein